MPSSGDPVGLALAAVVMVAFVAAVIYIWADLRLHLAQRLLEDAAPPAPPYDHELDVELLDEFFAADGGR